MMRSGGMLQMLRLQKADNVWVFDLLIRIRIGVGVGRAEQHAFAEIH